MMSVTTTIAQISLQWEGVCMRARDHKRGGIIDRLRERWRTHRRLKHFSAYVNALPVGDHPEERVITYRSPVDQREQALFVSAADYRCMLINRHTQDHKIKAFMRILSEGRYQQYVDIGANYGEFVAGALSVAPHLLAIEANPIVARCLKRSFNEHEQVNVIDRAVSSVNENLEMRINPQYSGGNRLIEEDNETPDFFLDGSSFILDVPCLKLAEVLENHLSTQESVAIKIDVEGHEAVLLDEIIEWFQPGRTSQLLIMFEFNANSDHAIQRLQAQVSTLIEMDFELSTICSRKVDFIERTFIPRDRWREAFRETCEIILELKNSCT